MYEKLKDNCNIFIIIKPSKVQGDIIKEVMNLFNTDCYLFLKMKLEYVFVREFYHHVSELPIYNDMTNYLSSFESIVMMVKYNNRTPLTLKQMKKYIRNKYQPIGNRSYENIIHISDDMREGKHEINLFYDYYLRDYDNCDNIEDKQSK